MLRKWEDIPEFMRLDEVRPYWEILYKKRRQLELKRMFDVVMAFILAVLLIIPMRRYVNPRATTSYCSQRMRWEG